MSEFPVDVYRRLRQLPELFERLQEAAGDSLRLQSELRREFPDDVVRLAVSMHELRHKARTKFDRAESMWFDRVGLEQSTPLSVARHKARRFTGPVWDLCCGIGADSVALAEHYPTCSVDRRLQHCLMTRWNAAAYGVADHVQPICGDVTALRFKDELVHIDPDRRTGNRRALRIEDYSPGPEFLDSLVAECRGGAIKLGPASNFGGKFPGCEVELISMHGECKEATVWFGELRTQDVHYRATVLPSGESLAADPLSAWPQRGTLGRYLFDPDPAVVRAGLVDVLAERFNLQRLDEEEEYLTGDDLVQTAFVRAFEVQAELPNNDRQIRGWFRDHPHGDVEIKCRRIPIDADKIRRRLPLATGERGVLFLARIGGKSRAVAARRIE